MKFRITLVHLEDNETRTDVFLADTRYQAVAKAFMAFAQMEQHDCLDVWKVLACDHIIPGQNVNLERTLDNLKAVLRQGDLTNDERQATKYVLKHCLAVLDEHPEVRS